MIALMVPVSHLGAQYTQLSLVGAFVGLLLVAAIVNRPAPRRMVLALVGIAAMFGSVTFLSPDIIIRCVGYYWFC